MITNLMNFKISNENIRQLRFLLHGPIGAGKSSTINTIKTIFEGCPSPDCLASSDTDATGKSFTKKNTLPSSDPAGLRALQEAVMAQGRLLGSHEQHLQQLNRTMEELIHSLRSLQPPTPPAARTDPTPAPLTATGPPPSSLPFAVPLSIPDKYDGTPDLCQGFLMQCSLYFSRAPTAFPSEDAKIAFVLSLLTGKALRWATAVWGAQSSVMQTYASFEHQFKEVFDHSGTGKDPGKQLLHLKQGNSMTLDFSLTFHTLAAESGWDDQALKTVYRNGLNEQLKSELACKDDAQTLDGLIKLSIRLDNLIRSRRQVYSSITTPAS
ncbi:hypothetical protein MHYP_G00072410 [Metynnis hypsauchen]